MIEAIKDRLSGKVPAGAKRSKEWGKVRKAHLELHPACEVCASTKNLQVHHVQPFHFNPEMELLPTNLITLCESKGRNCHLTFGHLGSFKSFNAEVRKDSAQWNDKIKNRP
jgi:5-methylcytosine-specific restriction protein A